MIRKITIAHYLISSIDTLLSWLLVVYFTVHPQTTHYGSINYKQVFIINNNNNTYLFYVTKLKVENKSKLSFRDTATSSAASHNENILQSLIYVLKY